MKIITITHLFLLSLLFSCVGTVTETAVPKNQESAGTSTTFNFPGIQVGRAISHNRIEVEFQPLAGPDYEYYLYVNDAQSPVKLDPAALYPKSGGRVLYTIEGLKPNTEHKLKVSAINLKTGAVSANENVIFTKTYMTEVANFSGVVKAEPTPGNRIKSIDVHWIAPKMAGVLLPEKYDPECYEVTYISEIGGPGNLNNPYYSGNDRKVVYQPNCRAEVPVKARPANNPSSIQITDLEADTRYYIQVRAIHKEYNALTNDGKLNVPTAVVDSNTRYVVARTDPATGDASFNTDSLILTNVPANPPEEDPMTQIDATWLPATGAHKGYRVFYKKYVGDPAANTPILEDAVLEAMTPDSYKVVPSGNTVRIGSLETAQYYQVRVALCTDENCTISKAIISDHKTIQVRAQLASFTGINKIENPGAFSQKDMVVLKYDPPVKSNGWANKFEIYCVNPADHTDMVELPLNVPLTGSDISVCNNLYIEQPGSANIFSDKEKVIKNIIANGKTQYCFAATPAIVGYPGGDLKLPNESRIVRCSYPEVKPPTIEEFPGIANPNVCSVSFQTANVNWPKPNGGIYSGFRVFWKEKVVGQPFSFADALEDKPGYKKSRILKSDVFTYTVGGVTDGDPDDGPSEGNPPLLPGRSYQFGVLAVTDLPAPTGTLYSEYNLNIMECKLPLPIPKFKGFTRIFAIGPKVDGRFPNEEDATTGVKLPPQSAKLFEAINEDGIPYEVPMLSKDTPKLDVPWYAPPGERDEDNLQSEFDGRPGEKGALSRNGIISIAWEDIHFSDDEDDPLHTIFTSNQAAGPRASRKWGYKVYRSHDNKLTWQNVTDESGFIYSKPYTYLKRPNGGAEGSVTTRMAFFTDYSVKALEERHQVISSDVGRDIDRARIYYYKVVPVFDGKELSFSITQNQVNIVRVTLPPPNMALVHRWMANRSHCLSIDKPINLSDNYSCDFNGLGSVGKTVPAMLGETKYDQSGDLLVDRFELGCRFTRGHIHESPEEGNSHFDTNKVDEEVYPMFRGWRSEGKIETETPFQGCIGYSSLANNAGNPPNGYTADYLNYIHGDCTGSSGYSMPIRACETLDPDLSKRPPSYIFVTPGLGASPGVKPCDSDLPSNPSNYELLTSSPDQMAKFVMQSEFLAVYHNRFINSSASSGYLRDLPFWGPKKQSGSITETFEDKREHESSGTNQCAINLAAINGSGYMRSRWVEISKLSDGLKFEDSFDRNLLEMTVAEITKVQDDPTAPQTFYDSENFQKPDARLMDSPRYYKTTQLGRIMASNSAKLPPLGNVKQSVGEAICGTSWVEVGIANDNSQFAVIQSAKQKRLTRRPEFITASAWPDNYEDTKIAQLENATEVYAPGGSCMNDRRAYNGSDISKGIGFRNSSTLWSPINNDNIPLLTGSSPYHMYSERPDGDHSQWCTSKYGIQDLIGNSTEINSERIFCDYSQDKLFIGPVSGGWPGNLETTEGAAVDGHHFELTNTGSYSYILFDGGTPEAEGNTFEIRYHTWSPSGWELDRTLKATEDYTNFKLAPWVQKDVNSGFCSIVTDDSESRNDNRFTNGLFWKNLFMPGGLLNPMVTHPQKDQEAVKFLRNGDGYFADFGPAGLLPSMKERDTLGQTYVLDRTEGKYFSPIFGLPVKCATGTCEDSIDNTYVTIPGLASVFPIDEEEESDLVRPTIKNFYIGNSEIKNEGITSYTNVNPSTASAKRIVVKETDESAQVLVAINVDENGVPITNDPANMGVNGRVYKNFPADFPEGATVSFFNMYWNLARGTVLTTISGGSVRTRLSGRYTASVQSNIGAYNNPIQGARCAILINED